MICNRLKMKLLEGALAILGVNHGVEPLVLGCAAVCA